MVATFSLDLSLSDKKRDDVARKRAGYLIFLAGGGRLRPAAVAPRPPEKEKSGENVPSPDFSFA